jgi:hypothetical protein
MAFPRRVREITPAWLTEVLRESGGVRRANVTSLEPEEIGTFSNQLWRLRLGYDRGEAAAPASLVLKRPQRHPRQDPGQGLADEIRFYRELGSRVDVRTPRFHFGAVDEETAQALLLMEDVGGFVPLDWRGGATSEHARLALEDLARLHAQWWERVADCGWVPSFADAAHRESLATSYDREWAARLDLFRSAAPDFVQIGDALVGRVAESLGALGEPETLLHGDAHLENLVLIDEEGRRVVLFHDWAGVRRGLASFDVAVFLVMSFPVDVRRRIERDLVALHAEALQAARVRGAPDPWTGYRRGVLAWAVRLVEFAGAFSPEDPAANAALAMVLERCTTAAVDLSVGELIA